MTQRSITLQLPDAAATHALGVQLGRVLPAGTVLLLNGELGSGKTSLVQGLGVGLGVVETVDSPTFTLVNEYLSGRLPLYHMDLYRLNLLLIPVIIQRQLARIRRREPVQIGRAHV